MFALKRILVPTNLGAPSQTALKYGAAFARQFRAKLIIVRVLPAREFAAAIETERVMEVLEPETPFTEESGTELDAQRVASNAARHELRQLLSLEDERATEAEYLLRASGVAGAGEAIVECAKERDVQLIVMGKHRLGFVEHLLAGSVTEKVMRHAPCPVLIVQHPENDFVVAEKVNAAP